MWHNRDGVFAKKYKDKKDGEFLYLSICTKTYNVRAKANMKWARDGDHREREHHATIDIYAPPWEPTGKPLLTGMGGM